MGCHVEEADTLLHVSVDVLGAVVAGLDASLDEHLVEGVAGDAAGDVEGAGAAPVVVLPVLMALGLLEVGQAILVVPSLGSLLFPSAKKSPRLKNYNNA